MLPLQPLKEQLLLHNSIISQIILLSAHCLLGTLTVMSVDDRPTCTAPSTQRDVSQTAESVSQTAVQVSSVTVADSFGEEIPVFAAAHH